MEIQNELTRTELLAKGETLFTILSKKIVITKLERAMDLSSGMTLRFFQDKTKSVGRDELNRCNDYLDNLIAEVMAFQEVITQLSEKK